MSRTLDLKKITTVGELKAFLEDIPDSIEISIESTGRSGYVDGVELEYFEPDLIDGWLDINIEAESCYVY